MAGEQVLLVEGPEDAYVVKHLCDFYGLASKVVLKRHTVFAEGINIKDEEGVDNLLKNLTRWLRGSAVQQLGIVVDADSSSRDRWKAIRNVLIKAGYEDRILPNTPDPNGTIILHPTQQVGTIGVWLMPDNVAAGMLEDFISRLIQPSDPLWSRAVQVVDQIPLAEWRFNQATKAYIHTWLAWQEEPGKPMSVAIHPKHYLDAQAPVAQTFENWLWRLFGGTPPAS